MKKIINYENEIKFKNKIAFINSISLEDNYKVENNKLLINFIVSGDYKMNELSVNNESFSYDLPLEYELDDHVDLSTIACEIENFEYETDENTLGITIDYKLNYDEKEEKIILPSEEELNEEIREDVIKKETQEKEEINVESFTLDEEKEDNDEVSVLKVHIYKLGETIESIASLYGTSADLIKQYNDTSNLEEKDKHYYAYRYFYKEV